MVFRSIYLYGNDSDISLAKAKGINMSKLFRNALRTELELELEDGLERVETELKLKSEINRLKLILEEVRKERDELKRYKQMRIEKDEKNLGEWIYPS